MFACIYSRSVSPPKASWINSADPGADLVDLAFTFSPLVEQTTSDTIVLDVSGQDLMFGPSPSCKSSPDEIESVRSVANKIARRASDLKMKINVAVAVDPDVAIHAAKAFKGVTVIRLGEELSHLGNLSIQKLDHSLVQIDSKRAQEVQETFALWGIRTFGDLARLPLAGVAERLGQDGVRLQKLAQGKTDRRLNLVRPPIGFEQSLDLEHPVSELEPLSFILSRLLNQLCANLHDHALATNELKLRLILERGSEYRLQSGIAANESPTDVGALNATGHYECAITLPTPMRNPKTLLRLLLFEIERESPQAPITAVTITAEPVKPRASQTGLFIPLAPEPEKLEITLARLAKLVGPDNVGSPEILNTNRPDAFRMKKFRLDQKTRRNGKKTSWVSLNAGGTPAPPVMAFRIFRPAWRAEVRTRKGIPARIYARGEQASGKVHGDVVCAAGPWRASGDWWRPDVWARDEWDIAVVDAAATKTKVLCRIYRDLTSEQWFVEGIYD
jgi:protein ImuB